MTMAVAVGTGRAARPSPQGWGNSDSGSFACGSALPVVRRSSRCSATLITARCPQYPPRRCISAWRHRRPGARVAPLRGHRFSGTFGMGNFTHADAVRRCRGRQFGATRCGSRRERRAARSRCSGDCCRGWRLFGIESVIDHRLDA